MFTGEEGMDSNFEENQRELAAEFDRLVGLGMDPREARMQVSARDRKNAENFRIAMESPVDEAVYLKDTERPTEEAEDLLEDAA
jgi:hypothetical protein